MHCSVALQTNKNQRIAAWGVFSIAAWYGQLGFNGNYSWEEHYDHCIIGMNAIVEHGVVVRTLKWVPSRSEDGEIVHLTISSPDFKPQKCCVPCGLASWEVWKVESTHYKVKRRTKRLFSYVSLLLFKPKGQRTQCWKYIWREPLVLKGANGYGAGQSTQF